MASTSPLNLTPTFLVIPPEVRLRIYFFVFEKERGDECFLSGAYFGSVSEGPITRKSKAERSIEHLDDLTSLGRHPEILRVNHQIYFEAFPVLYSGLVMIDPSKGTWSYKPLENNLNAYYYGKPQLDDFFEIVYDPPLLHGVTKPERLDKFAKVLLVAKIRLTTGELEWRYDEENGSLSIAAQEELTEDLLASEMIEGFVELLAGCSWVDHVDLDIGLEALWEEDQEAPGFIRPGQNFETAHLDALRKIWHKGDIQVAEIFLASGILDPLRRLSNVRSWCIELTLEKIGPTICMHERMALDISNGIKQTRTQFRNGHNSQVIPCGLLWKPIL